MAAANVSKQQVYNSLNLAANVVLGKFANDWLFRYNSGGIVVCQCKRCPLNNRAELGVANMSQLPGTNASFGPLPRESSSQVQPGAAARSHQAAKERSLETQRGVVAWRQKSGSHTGPGGYQQPRAKQPGGSPLLSLFSLPNLRSGYPTKKWLTTCRSPQPRLLPPNPIGQPGAGSLEPALVVAANTTLTSHAMPTHNNDPSHPSLKGTAKPVGQPSQAKHLGGCQSVLGVRHGLLLVLLMLLRWSCCYWWWWCCVGLGGGVIVGVVLRGTRDYSWAHSPQGAPHKGTSAALHGMTSRL
ncbi:hypothetical protein V8C86DRAFT_3179070 [Haematococcus lacustris]